MNLNYKPIRMKYNNLISKLQTYKNTPPTYPLTSLINLAHRSLTPQTLPIIHAFFLNIQRQKLNVPSYHIKPLVTYINFLKSKLKYIDPTLKLADFELKSIKNYDEKQYQISDNIVTCVLQILVKSSFKEIENMIHSYFGERKLRVFVFNECVVYMIERMKNVEDKVKGYSLLSRILEFDSNINADYVKSVMDYFARHKIDCSIFFNILYLTNCKLYELFHDFTLSESYKRFDFVKSLPYFNLENKELSEQLIRYIIEHRPVYKQIIVDYLVLKRDLLFSVVKDYYSFFPIDRLNLSFEEHLLLCETNDENVFFLFEYLKFFEEDDKSAVSKFVKMLIAKDEIFLRSFFETFYTSKSEIYETIVLVFLKSKKLGDKLHKFFIEYFIDKIKVKNSESVNLLHQNTIGQIDHTTQNDKSAVQSPTKIIENIDADLHTKPENQVEDILENKKSDIFEGFSPKFAHDTFFLLIYYIDKPTIIKNIETYLSDESTLREFLKVLTPHELYYNIHYFKNIQKSLAISQIIASKPTVFDEQVSMSIISLMEESDLPPLFMRTVLVSFGNFPSMKKYIYDLMKRMVKLEIWNMPRLYDGFVRCLIKLKNACVEIVMMMPVEQMKDIFERSEEILMVCEEYIKNHSGLRGKYAFLFKNTVYSHLKKNGKLK